MPTGWNYSEALCQVELQWVSEIEYGLNVLIACRQSSGVAKRQDGTWIQRHETLLVFVLMLVSLAVLVVFIAPDLLFPATESGTVSDFSVKITASGEPNVDPIACLAARGISKDTLVYIYSDTCSASQDNTPWVLALPGNGYKVFMANTANTSAIAVVTTCLKDIALFAGTPEYICPSTEAVQSGAFSSAIDLENFAKACR
jgi:hypothetical protein